MFETIASVLTWLTDPTNFTVLGFLTLGIVCAIEFWDFYRTPRLLGKVASFIKLLETGQKQLDSNRDRDDFLLEDSHSDFRRFWSYLEGRVDTRGFLAKYDANKFILLQYPSELAGAIPTSPFKFVPGIFISLGVFGTFWGITQGLQGLDTTSNSDELFEASKILINGMKTAFFTSLVGMTCSIVLTLWQGILQNLRRSQYEGLRKRLDKVAFMESAERLLARQDTSGLGAASEALKIAADGLKNLNAQAIGEAVGSEMKPVFDEIRGELAQLRSEIGKDRQELITTLIAEQEERLIKPVVAQLQDTNQLTRDTSEAVISLKDSLGGITHELGEAVKTIQEFQKETLTELKAFADGLKTTLDDFTENQKTVIGDMTNELKASIIETTQSQTELIRSVGDEAANTMRIASQELQTTLVNLDQRLGQFTDGLGDQLDRFTTTLNDRFSTLLQQMVDTITETTQQQTLLIQESGEQAAKTITKASDDSAANIERIAEKSNEMLINAAQQLHNVGEEAANTMRIASQELQTTLSNLDQRLGQFTDRLGDQLDRFTTTLNDRFSTLLKQMVDTITETTREQTVLIQQTGEQAASTIKTASDESAENIKRIAGESSVILDKSSDMLTYAAQQLRDTLLTIDAELTKIRITVQKELEKFRDEYMKSLEKFFEDNDKKLEKILLKYTDRMEGSVTRIDEIFQKDYDERVKIHGMLLKEVKTVEDFANQVGLTSADRLAQLGSIVSKLGTEAKQIQDRYENFIGVLNEGFKTSNDHLKDSLELIYQRETDFFEKADSTVNTLAERLTNAASLIVIANQQTETD